MGIVYSMGRFFRSHFGSSFIVKGDYLLDDFGHIVRGDVRTYVAQYNPRTGQMLYFWTRPKHGNAERSARGQCIRYHLPRGLTPMGVRATIEGKLFVVELNLALAREFRDRLAQDLTFPIYKTFRMGDPGQVI